MIDFKWITVQKKKTGEKNEADIEKKNLNEKSSDDFWTLRSVAESSGINRMFKIKTSEV